MLKYKEGDYIWDISTNRILCRITKISLDYNKDLRVEVNAGFSTPVTFSYNFLLNNNYIRLATKAEVLLYVNK